MREQVFTYCKSSQALRDQKKRLFLIDGQEGPEGGATAVAVDSPAKQAEAGAAEVGSRAGGVPGTADAGRVRSSETSLNTRHRVEKCFDDRWPLSLTILQVVEQSDCPLEGRAAATCSEQASVDVGHTPPAWCGQDQETEKRSEREDRAEVHDALGCCKPLTPDKKGRQGDACRCKANGDQSAAEPASGSDGLVPAMNSDPECFRIKNFPPPHRRRAAGLGETPRRHKKNATSGGRGGPSKEPLSGRGSLGRRRKPAREPLIRRAMLAEVPLTGLSFVDHQCTLSRVPKTLASLAPAVGSLGRA